VLALSAAQLVALTDTQWQSNLLAIHDFRDKLGAGAKLVMRRSGVQIPEAAPL